MCERSTGRRAAFFALLCLLCVVLCGAPRAWSGDFDAPPSPTNFGLTGLWEYPTAEMPADGGGRFGYTHASPYAYWFIDLAWLPWLEMNVRLSTFDNVWVAPSGAINNTGNGRDYMDKAIDLKAMLWRAPKSKWYLPSLAFGVTDIMGTELMKAWYGVATWRLGDVSVSVGYGTDRMNGVFAGVAWDVTRWLTLKAEYSPMDYSQDAAGGHRPHPGEPSSKFNVGAIFRAPWGTEASLSWQRGEEFVVSITQRFDLNGPFLFPDGSAYRRPMEAPGEARPPQWGDVEPDELVRRIGEGLEKYVKVRDVQIEIGDRQVHVAYENYGHGSHAEAMVRVLVVLAAVLPQVESLTLTPRMSGVPVVRAEFPGELLFDIRARSLRDEPLQPAVFAWADGRGRGLVPVRDANDDREEREHNEGTAGDAGGVGYTGEGEGVYRAWLLKERARHDLKIMAVYEPRIDQTLDADYQNRWSLDLVYQGRWGAGWSGLVDVRFPLYNNVKIPWEPDMNDEPRLQRAVASYVKNWTSGDGGPGLWLVGEAGWLDEDWFGINLWGRRWSQDGRWWVGARASFLRDRDPDSFAGLAEGEIRYVSIWHYDTGENPWALAAWLQAGYHFSGIDLDLQADWGRFVDSDTGFKISAIRRWDDTALGFWLSKTERLAPNKDFTRAGVHLELPAEKWFGSWFGRPSAHIWEQDVLLLSTWRIDAGREGGQVRTPERLLGQLRPMLLKENVTRLLKEYCSFEPGERAEPEVQSLADLIPAFRQK